MSITTVKVSVETREILNKLKIIPRETYDQVIKRLIDVYKTKKGNSKES